MSRLFDHWFFEVNDGEPSGSYEDFQDWLGEQADLALGDK